MRMSHGWYRIATLAILALSGCAPTNLYKQWDATLGGAVVGDPAFYTKSDVSLMLGSTPTHCDSTQGATPVIGIMFDSADRITRVAPGGPADSAGLRVGMVIRSVAGQPTLDIGSLQRAFNASARVGAPLVVSTDAGSFSPVPRAVIEEQCYWEVGSGNISTSRAGVSIVPGVGAAGGSRSASYQRFYRLTGRFVSGVLVRYASNWQF
jgi:hypothetical protein